MSPPCQRGTAHGGFFARPAPSLGLRLPKRCGPRPHVPVVRILWLGGVVTNAELSDLVGSCVRAPCRFPENRAHLLGAPELGAVYYTHIGMLSTTTTGANTL